MVARRQEAAVRWPLSLGSRGSVALVLDRLWKAGPRIPLGFGRSRRRSPRTLHLYGWDWAPGGRRVVFAAAIGVASPRLYTISIDGRHRRGPLRRGAGPEWSSEGRHICSPPHTYIPMGGSPSCGRMAAVFASDRLDPHAAPNLSPDGRRIVFVRLADITSPTEWRVVDLTGNIVVVVGSQRSPKSFWCPPGWTPDGTRLAAARGNRFVTMNLDGADERAASKAPGICDFSWRPRSDDLAGEWICTQGAPTHGNPLHLCQRYRFQAGAAVALPGGSGSGPPAEWKDKRLRFGVCDGPFQDQVPQTPPYQRWVRCPERLLRVV